jgi:hypothetical protein
LDGASKSFSGVRASFLPPSPTEKLKIEIHAGETTTSREATKILLLPVNFSALPYV